MAPPSPVPQRVTGEPRKQWRSLSQTQSRVRTERLTERVGARGVARVQMDGHPPESQRRPMRSSSFELQE
ncbi:hypothetical protein OH77DRAFT_1425946 [Trametes cingulata]|nr:hypothetical protein OH77DRAFT_1425946 [Trametes cingulata]